MTARPDSGGSGTPAGWRTWPGCRWRTPLCPLSFQRCRDGLRRATGRQNSEETTKGQGHQSQRDDQPARAGQGHHDKADDEKGQAESQQNPRRHAVSLGSVRGILSCRNDVCASPLRSHLHMPDNPGDTLCDLHHLAGQQTLQDLYGRYDRDAAADRLARYRAVLARR